MNRKAEEILSGFDRIVEKTEAMPVTPEEKRGLIKEWLRSLACGNGANERRVMSTHIQ